MAEDRTRLGAAQEGQEGVGPRGTDPGHPRRSLGSHIILDHVVQARLAELPYVYLGYWVKGSEKMDYKVRFEPIELLRPEGWTLMSARDRAPALAAE